MKPDPLIFKAKTAYTDITIETCGDQITLLTDKGAVQSRINRQSPHSLELQNLRSLLGILLFIPAPKKICLLGVGGGSLIHFLRHYYPLTQITAVDIDAELIGLMHDHMALPSADQALRYVIGDAAEFIRDNNEQFDLIVADLFLGDRSPEWLLATDSMQAIHKQLSKSGGVAYNLLINDEQSFMTYYENLRQVFNQQTLCLPVEGLDNTIAYALSSQPRQTDMTVYLQKAIHLGEQQGIEYREILGSIYHTNPSGCGVI